MYATAPGDYKPAPVLEKGEAGLRQLAELLEHEQTWRDRWRWDYTTIGAGVSATCGTAGCAMGLAMTVWPDQVSNLPCSTELADLFGVPEEWAYSVFLQTGNVCGVPMDRVTPGMVAARIRERVGW